MLVWIGDRLLGLAAKAGLQILDNDQSLAMPPRCLNRGPNEAASKFIPAVRERGILSETSAELGAASRSEPDRRPRGRYEIGHRERFVNGPFRQ